MKVRITRRIATLVGALAIVTAAGSTVANAAEDNVSIQKRFMALYSAANYTGALVEAKKMEAWLRTKVGTSSPHYVVALNMLGNTYIALGNYDEAAAWLTKAVDLSGKVSGPQSAETSVLIYNLATVRIEQGAYDEAEPLLKRGLPIFEAAHDNTRVVTALNALSIVYFGEGRYAQQEQTLKQALAISEKPAGKTGDALPDAQQINLADVLNGLGGLYQTLGKSSDAEAQYQRAIAVREKIRGGMHSELFAPLNNLALLLQGEERYSDAEALYQRSLAIVEKTQGPNHPRAAVVLVNLGSLRTEQGRYDEAEAFLKRALAIREKAGPSNDLEVAEVLDTLGDLYRKQGKYAAAEEVLKRSLTIREKPALRDHPMKSVTLRALGDLSTAKRNYDEAETFYSRADALARRGYGEAHPYTIMNLDAMSVLFAARGDVDRALAKSREATAATLAGRLAATSTEVKSADLREPEYFRHHVANLAASSVRSGSGTDAGREAFEIAQWATQSSAGAAVQQMALRFASGRAAGRSRPREPGSRLVPRGTRQGTDRSVVKARGRAQPDAGQQHSQPDCRSRAETRRGQRQAGKGISRLRRACQPQASEACRGTGASVSR